MHIVLFEHNDEYLVRSETDLKLPATPNLLVFEGKHIPDEAVLAKYITSPYDEYVNTNYLPQICRIDSAIERQIEEIKKEFCHAIPSEMSAMIVVFRDKAKGCIIDNKFDREQLELAMGQDDEYRMFGRYAQFYNMDLFTLLDEAFQALGWTYRTRRGIGQRISNVEQAMIEISISRSAQRHYSDAMVYRIINTFAQSLYVSEQRLVFQMQCLLCPTMTIEEVAQACRKHRPIQEDIWITRDNLIENAQDLCLDTIIGKADFEELEKHYRWMINSVRNEYAHRAYSAIDRDFDAMGDRIKGSFQFILVLFEGFYRYYIQRKAKE